MLKEPATILPLGQKLHAVEAGLPSQHDRVPIQLDYIPRVLDSLDVVRVPL